MDLNTAELATDLDPSVLERWLWDMRMSEHDEDIAKAAGVPISYVRGTLAHLDHQHTKKKMVVHHPHLNDFEILLEVLGVENGLMWGVARAKGRTPTSIYRRYKDMGVTEDGAILAMTPPVDLSVFDHIVVLKPIENEVKMLVGWIEGEFGEGNDIDVALDKLTS